MSQTSRQPPFKNGAAISAYDREHIWHPYSSLTNPNPVFTVASADGVRIKLDDGRELIDGMASWWSVIHGYNNPTLNRAVHTQVDTLAHVMFGGLTHRPAVELAARLIEITPAELTKVFFADSGSVAVEVAIKMSFQFQAARGESQKQRLLTVRGGYHGDTFGAMAVCDPVTGMHGLFRDALTPHIFAERPSIEFHQAWQDSATESLERTMRANHREIAGVIVEPIVQGAGGMRFYHPQYLRELRRLCDEFDILLIFDEIATGFGRSGKLFAAEHADVTPDIMCLGKALTGGYMSLAATLCSDHVADTISGGEPGLFMHGPTFMANPLACAVATASIDLLLESNWSENIHRIERLLTRGLEPCIAFPNVRSVRTLGAIGVVELIEPVDMHIAPQRFVELGVWVRPFGCLVYVMPPYVITDDDLTTLTDSIKSVVASLHPSMISA